MTPKDIKLLNEKIIDLRKEAQAIFKEASIGLSFTEKVIEFDAELIRAQRKLQKILEMLNENNKSIH